MDKISQILSGNTYTGTISLDMRLTETHEAEPKRDSDLEVH